MRCGVPASKGKIAVERLLEVGTTALEMPSAPDDLPVRLEMLGIIAVRRRIAPVDVAAIRDKAGMTQEEFAAAYGLTAATVRNWEQHRSEPDAAARAFLRVIDLHPEIAEEAVTA
jgi:putative transcriptional regulator